MSLLEKDGLIEHGIIKDSLLNFIFRKQGNKTQTNHWYKFIATNDSQKKLLEVMILPNRY